MRRKKSNGSPFVVVLIVAAVMAVVIDEQFGSLSSELPLPLGQLVVIATATSQPVPARLLPSPTSTAYSTLTPTPRPTVVAMISPGQSFAAVRSRPSALSTQVGSLQTGEQVRVLGSLVDGVWYEIEYPAAPGGKGWVYASLVILRGNGVPFIGPDGSVLTLPLLKTRTPSP